MLFWDEPLEKRRHARLKQLPPVPDTGWRVPQYFPDLSDAVVISFDVETKELDFDNGPGWARNQGHIVGVSVGAEDRRGNRGAWYFPVRHEVGTECNLDPRNVFGYCKEVLETRTAHVPKIGANITYDIGWLAEENIFVSGPLNDVQYAEALIDSEARVALDILGRKYVGSGKTTDVMYRWMEEAYPNTPKAKRRGDIYRTPPQLVGYYAEDDANLPIDIFHRQLPILQAEQLDYVYRLECDLIPLMVSMRRRGVTVDRGLAVEMRERLVAETEALYVRVRNDFGSRPESMDSRQIGPLLEMNGVTVPRSDAGNYSVTKEWLAALDHPLGEVLNSIREHEKIIGTFIDSYILKKSIPVPGSNTLAKIYPQFHQLKGDENGTVVGRFASSDPNLQNIPSRTKLGKLVRTCFVPEMGHSHWQKNDFSQVHYRILAHYAVGPGADELRDAYINDPKMDYHDNVYYKVCPILQWDATDEDMRDYRRRPIKNINFGLLYGQSLKSLMYKTASYFGSSFSEADGDAFFKAYFEGAPYVKPTMEAIGKEVQEFGYVTTILGRRVRFNLWEPVGRGRKGDPLPYEMALSRYGSPLRRAYEYRGVNYKFQGSEPDIMKEGMRKLWKSGVFDYVGVPLITVHDELDFSVPEGETYTKTKKGKEVTAYRPSKAYAEAYAFIKATMESSVKLRVPLRADESAGLNWGTAD